MDSGQDWSQMSYQGPWGQDLKQRRHVTKMSPHDGGRRMDLDILPQKISCFFFSPSRSFSPETENVCQCVCLLFTVLQKVKGGSKHENKDFAPHQEN